MLFARGRVVAIVVIVALAGLVGLGAAKPRGLNDNSSQFYSSIIVNFFPFCGLEECAMHIDNPQMRGLFFCGVTRHVCRGYDRLRIFGGPPPNTKLLQGLGELAPSTKPVAGSRGIVTNVRGAHSPSPITRITFGVMDIEKRAIPYLSYAYPIVRFQSSSNQVPMRFQWR